MFPKYRPKLKTRKNGNKSMKSHGKQNPKCQSKRNGKSEIKILGQILNEDDEESLT